MKNSLIKTILIYIVFFIIVFVLYKYEKIETYAIYLILSFVWILIKDILLYLVNVESRYFPRFDKWRLFKDFKKSRISFINFSLVLNRNLLFPVVLVWYMIYLLIWQTKLFWLDDASLYEAINSNYLLWITIFSWILTIFKEDIDKKYFYDELVWWYYNKNIILTVVLSLLWTYIIFNQVIKLWLLSYPISIISGILIFLVWISILEDDDSEEEV